MVKSKEIIRTQTNIIKKDMVGYFLYSKQYLVAFTESYNNADVFAIKKSHYTIEVEIKNTRDDLRGELNSIKYLLDNEKDGKPTATKKYYKHLEYLRGRVASGDRILPNEFCFLVPEEIVEQAYAGIQGTPYGLFCYKPYLGDYYSRIEEVIKPEKIHGEKYDFSKNMELLFRASNECQFLREKIYGGWPDQSFEGRDF